MHDRGGFSDEAIPFRQALTLWGWGDSPPTVNPHFFSYPSLSIYVHWAAQWVAAHVGRVFGRYGTISDAGVECALDPTYLVSWARAATSLIAVWAAWMAYLAWRDRSAWVGVILGGFLLLCPALVRATMQLPPESLMCPLVVALGVQLARGQRVSPPVEMASGITAGLLCGIKYSALPVLLVCVVALGIQARSLRAVAMIGLRTTAWALGAFVVTTPCSVLAAHEFLRGASFDLVLLTGGHIAGGHWETIRAHAGQLFSAVGFAATAALASFCGNRAAWTRRASIPLALALAFVVPALLAPSGGPERYIVPAIPSLWLFTAEMAFHGLSSQKRAARLGGWLVTVCAALQLSLFAATVLRPSHKTPVACASDWIRRNAGPDQLAVRDPGALVVFTKADREGLMRSRCLASASSRWKERARQCAAHTLISVPFFAAGDITATIETAAAGSREITVFSPGWRMLPRLYEAVREIGPTYWAVNSGVRARLAAALQERAPGLDRSLGVTATRCAGPSGGVFTDPAVNIQRFNPSDKAATALAAGWWLADAAPIAPGSGQDSAAVLLAHREVYQECIRPLLFLLAQAARDARDFETVARASRLMVIEDPGDLVGVRLALIGLGRSQQSDAFATDGTRRVARAPDEPIDRWLSRVLGEWGVPPEVASAEAARYLHWSLTQG